MPSQNDWYPLEIKHGVLENGPFLCDFPLKTSIDGGFSIAMFDCQRVVANGHELRVQLVLVAGAMKLRTLDQCGLG